jgi:PAS domain S-box-containing protein
MAHNGDTTIRDPARLATLRNLALLDTPAEHAFDRLTRLAATILHVPMALVSLVDAERQFFKSCIGLPEPWASQRETPLSHSFCRHAVESAEPLIIADAREHPLVRDNQGIHELDMIAYAGIPLITSDRYVLGSFCVTDNAPREWTAAEVEILQDLAASVMTEIELRGEIIERRKAEEVLHKHSAEELDRFFTLSLDMLCIAGFDGYFRRLSPAWERTLGFSVAELQAKPFLYFVHPDDREKTGAAADQLQVGQDVILFENRYRCKDGTYRWIEWKATSFPDRQLIYAVARDVTERKQLEAQVMQAQKMESVGRLAGGVAHDFNNLLTAISGYTELVLDELTPTDPIRADMFEIQRTARRAATLTHQLLAFAREQTSEPRVLNLNDLILNMDRLLRRLIGADVELVTLPATQLDQVRVDPGQIEQIIVNLALNARDAMPDGGKLMIETANVYLDSHYARQHIGVAEGAHVMLAVSDTGMGMDEDVQQHIFEPFFTTKQQGKGSGIGLATCYGIVRQHSGHILIYSEAGLGTTIKVYLPRVEPAAPSSHDSAPRLPKGTETVLVAEDEMAVRKLTARVLRGQGYTVLEATNGEEALRVAGQHRGTIDLLLTDMVMPQMGGAMLAERFHDLSPATRVVFMSGYTENSVLQTGQIRSGVVLLQKPFTPAVLARKVREVLDG